MNAPCQIDSAVQFGPAQNPRLDAGRRRFLKRLGLGVSGLTCADFLGYFAAHGLPQDAAADRLAEGAAAANDDPRFLVYWYLEGGWCGYDMFNPVMTANNVVDRLDDISAERYRVLQWGEPGYGIKKSGSIRYGYLAEDGRGLFPDMAVLSSMSTGSGHSRDRLKVHMGSYGFKQTEEREEDERSVMQAFAEAYGQPYALPSLSWHWWLSDGELNEAQYTGRRGYYHALGPAHAHTIYAGTPEKLKTLLGKMREESANRVSSLIEGFLDNARHEFLDDNNLAAVKSYQSARTIYRQMAARGQELDGNVIARLFTDSGLREAFGVRREDELITYRSVNGNKARSKFSPNTNVQAMMSYEMMREGLSCAFFIESRDVRRFDSHLSRGRLWKSGTGEPVGMRDQTQMMREDLWEPLTAFVDQLKKTEYRETGRSLFDATNIVVNSEFGRSMHGDVAGILKKEQPEQKKTEQINGQDICSHWKVTSCAFLGGNVRGDSQFGRAGERTLMPIPLMPDGTMDPNYDPVTGELKKGREPHPKGFVPNHGDVYATALALSGLDPKGRGRNERPPMRFVQRG